MDKLPIPDHEIVPLDAVAPDVKAGRVYFLAGDGSPRKLLSFDPQTFLQVGAMDVP